MAHPPSAELHLQNFFCAVGSLPSLFASATLASGFSCLLLLFSSTPMTTSCISPQTADSKKVLGFLGNSYFINSYYVPYYVTETSVTRNGSVNKLTLQKPQSASEPHAEAKEERGLFKGKEAISERLENLALSMAQPVAHHPNF